ncbi:translation initiation factor IF-2 isoform X1 [Helicoverpa armigera]
MLKFLTHKLRTHSLNEESVSEKVEERDSGTESDDDAAPPGDFCTDVIMKWNDVTDISMGGEACACAPAPPRLLPDPEPDHLYDHHSSEEELEVINGLPRGAEGASAALPRPAGPGAAPRLLRRRRHQGGDTGAFPHVAAAGGSKAATRSVLVWGDGRGDPRGCCGARGGPGGAGGARQGPAVAAAPALAAAAPSPTPARARLRQDATAEGGRRRAVVARGGRRARRRALRLLLVMRRHRASALSRPRRPRTATRCRPQRAAGRLLRAAGGPQRVAGRPLRTAGRPQCAAGRPRPGGGRHPVPL